MTAALALPGCGGGPLGILTGGGPNVAANVQAGAENRQTINVGRAPEQRIDRPTAGTIEQSAGDTGVRSDKVENVVVQGDIPAWLIIAFAVALLLDSPLRWPGQIWNAFKRLWR